MEVQSQFIEMFGDPYRSAKYERIAIGDVTQVGTGATPDRNKANIYYGGGVNWVKSMEVCNCIIDHTDETITEQALAETNCSIYHPGTVVLAMYGQGKTRGQVGLLNIPAATNQAIAAIECSALLNPRFLFYHFIVTYNDIRKIGTGSSQKNLNLSLIKSMLVVLPPIEIQNKFVAIAEQADKSKFELRKSIEAIDKVIKSLINNVNV